MTNDLDFDLINGYPKSDQELIEKYLPSKLWRMNNLYKVKNKAGHMVTFKMNPLQLKVAAVRHNRKIILKSRQVGITTYHVIYNLDDCLFEDNHTNGIMAQGLAEAAEILEKARHAWESVPDEIKEFLGIKLTVDNTTEFGFSNKSKLLVRTSFRSGTLQNLHVSELGKIAARDPQKAKELKTGTFQAIGDDRKVTVESTAEGKAGYFYELWTTAENHQGEFSQLDFYPIFISWTEDPDCRLHTPQIIPAKLEIYFRDLENALNITLLDEQKWFYVAKSRELGDDITQEYPSTPEEAFQAAKDGSYYGSDLKALRKKRLVEDLYDPMLKVHVAMDLGMNDDFTMVFFQMYNREVRVIDEYIQNGEGLLHYVNVMRSKPYNYGRIFGPHDIRVKELGTGKSRWEVFRSLGVTISVVKNIAINDGIEAVRIMLANTWIDPKCGEILASLENYSKEWDERAQTWKNKPLHNKWSHMADAIRYMALSGAVGELAALNIKKPSRVVRSASYGFDV